MVLSFSAAARNAQLASLAALVDGGSGAGALQIRTGTRPAGGPDATATGTALVTFTLTDPAFETPAAGVMALDADPDLAATAAATGTAAWARVMDSAGVGVFDGTVGATGSGADIIITSTAIITGQTVTILSGTISQTA